MSVADHPRARAGQVAQCVEHAFGLAFLVQGDAEDHEHEEQQQQGLAHVAEQEI
jgi:hypothetical protein